MKSFGAIVLSCGCKSDVFVKTNLSFASAAVDAAAGVVAAFVTGFSPSSPNLFIKNIEGGHLKRHPS